MPRLITPAHSHRASALAVLAATALITACVPADMADTPNTGDSDATPRWYFDHDDDGFGDPTEFFDADQSPNGYVANGDDCNDDDPAINPDAVENNRDTQDNNCDGQNNNAPFSVGDYGPAGGVVFYVEPLSGQGLEVALNDAGSAEWGCFGDDLARLDNLVGGSYSLDSTSSTALAAAQTVGKGKTNTQIIIDGCSDENTAAKLAAAYVNATDFDDWFLPSIGELNLLYTFNNNLDDQSITGFTALANVFYWSSSQASGRGAWGQGFDGGSGDDFDKNLADRVRAVRAF